MLRFLAKSGIWWLPAVSLTKVRIWWVRVIGRRGSALFFFAFLDVIYSWSLLSLPPEARVSPTFQYVDKIAPIEVWGVAWGTVGLICFASAFVRRDFIAFTAAITIKILWALVYVSGDVAGDIYRGWVAASIWFALALLVKLISGWPEYPGGDKWLTQDSSSVD